MRQLWRTLSYLVSLHDAGYTGQVIVHWKDGVPMHTKTESSRTPDELPGDDARLLGVLSAARDEAA